MKYAAFLIAMFVCNTSYGFELLVDDFNVLNRTNSLNGVTNIYQTSNAFCKEAMRDGYIELTYSKKDDNEECGYNTFLRWSGGDYITTIPFSHISFRVKGLFGGEQFDVLIADEYLVEEEYPISLGMIDEHLHGGVTTEWQEVQVPLDRIRAMDTFQMEETAVIKINFHGDGWNQIFVDDIKFIKLGN